MPTYRFGNIWHEYEKTDAVCVTTNSTVHNGRLVMGGGIALDAMRMFPGIEVTWGNLISRNPPSLDSPYYGTIWSAEYPRLVALQTKTKPSMPSTERIIEYSIRSLMDLTKVMMWKRVDLAYPGIGLGGLPVERVQPIVELLPEMFHVWRFERERP